VAKILDMSGGTAKVVSGLPCIYFLGYATLYCEEVKEDADNYIFDPTKTVWLQFSPVAPDGGVKFGGGRGFGPGMPWSPTYLRCGKAACFITDCADEHIVRFCKRLLSGIILATERDIPPEAPPVVN